MADREGFQFFAGSGGAEHVVDNTHHDFTRGGQRHGLSLDMAGNVRPPDELLVAAGLQREGGFRRAFSYSNDVWIGAAVVLRVARASDPWTFGHEQAVLSWLPDAIPHPRILAAGEHNGRAWVVVQRVPGQELGRAWPGMTVRQRTDVIHQLGVAMHALHRVDTPKGWQRPDLEPAALHRLITPEDVAAPYQAPPHRIWALGEAARALSFVDTGLVDEAVQLSSPSARV